MNIRQVSLFDDVLIEGIVDRTTNYDKELTDWLRSLFPRGESSYKIMINGYVWRCEDI